MEGAIVLFYGVTNCDIPLKTAEHETALLHA